MSHARPNPFGLGSEMVHEIVQGGSRRLLPLAIAGARKLDERLDGAW